MSLRRRSFTHITRHFSTTTKVPTLYEPTATTSQNDGIPTTALQLLSWGRGASGQLGGGIEEIRLYPATVANLTVPSSSFTLSPTPGKIQIPSTSNKDGNGVLEVGIACGLFHSSLLVDGKVWIWGKGDGGLLGFGHENSAFLPTLNPYLDSIRGYGGYGGFGALGHSVYTRELFPRLVEGSWSGRIHHVSTSGTHTAAITESGELYTWGRDEGDGRLSLGSNRGPNEGGGLSIPSKVKALPMPVVAVSCGGFFTMVLTEKGELWNWGANSNFELGRGDRVGGWQPKPIPSLVGVRIIQIASGGYHSIALTDEGKVLSWGHGRHGQLGNSSVQNQKTPTVVKALTDERVIYIACGGSSSAAITDKGKLYMWGTGDTPKILN